MTDGYDWETVEVPQGTFIGWGTQGGQHVTGKIISYDVTGGRDYDGNVCPQISVELMEQAASFKKDGKRTDFPAGELVNVTCGQAGLKTAILRADPKNGDLIKITMTGVGKTNSGNDMKNFDLKIARGAGQTQTATPATAESEPPF